MRPRIILLLLIAIVTAIDSLTKAWALNLPSGGIQIVPGFFDLTLGFNAGVSFGLLAIEGVSGYVVLIVLTLTITCVLSGIAWSAKGWLARAGYGAIVGGALGNLLDRLPDGMVTDFLDVHAAGWHFPTFNLADVGITIGVALLLIAAVRRSV